MKTSDVHVKSQAELLAQFQADNLRLVAENLRLRAARRKLRLAFARYVNTHFIQVRAGKVKRG